MPVIKLHELDNFTHEIVYDKNNHKYLTMTYIHPQNKDITMSDVLFSVMDPETFDFPGLKKMSDLRFEKPTLEAEKRKIFGQQSVQVLKKTEHMVQIRVANHGALADWLREFTDGAIDRVKNFLVKHPKNPIWELQPDENDPNLFILKRC